MPNHDFNLTLALYSPSEGYRAYANYKYDNNTLGITDDEFDQIKHRWQKSLQKWDIWAQSTDGNIYEIPDDDFDASFMDGQKKAEENSGYERTSGKAVTQWGSNIAYGASGLGNGAYNFVRHFNGSYTNAVNNAKTATDATKSAKLASYNAAKLDSIAKSDQAYADSLREQPLLEGSEVEQTQALQDAERTAQESRDAADAAREEAAKAEDAAKEAQDNSETDWGVIASCAMALATGTAYTLQKPNQEETNALIEHQKTLAEAQTELGEAQSDMQYATEEAAAADEEANAANEDYQAQIEAEEANYEVQKVLFEAVKAKYESGEQLTEDEQMIYKDAAASMNKSGTIIGDLQSVAQEEVSAIYSDMTTYQDAYLNAQETMANVQGQTEFSASFDKATQVGCYITGVGQGLNAASGARAAYQAGELAVANGWNLMGITYGLAAAAGAAGAIMSGIGAFEQFKMADDVSKEIDVREATEGINFETSDVLDTELETFEFTLDDVSKLEIDTPDGTEQVEIADVSSNPQHQMSVDDNPEDDDNGTMIL